MLFLVTVMVMSGCKSLQTAANTTSNPTVVGERDGSSFEKAIIAKSIDSEYEWIRKEYPGSRVLGQALVQNDKKYYDVLTVKLSDGGTKKVYFDINSFFGKGF